MSRNLFLILIFCIIGKLLAHSETTNVEWLDKVVNLGIIQEDAGKVIGEFKFINKGNKKLKIRKVELSCGCTQAEYPQRKIEKEDTAIIKVVYDPEDKMGKFRRSVFVYFDKDTKPYMLHIEGTVNPDKETLKLLYPYERENLYFDTLEMDFGEMVKGNRQRRFVEIYNNGEETVKLEFEEDSDVMTFLMEPVEIRPGERGLITVFLDSGRIPGLGKYEYIVKGKSEDNEDIFIRVKVKTVYQQEAVFMP